LSRIAGAFQAFDWHDASMRDMLSYFQRDRALPYSKEPTTGFP
jgi:hypothetical protein